MPGTNMITGDESITFTDNMSFDGTERGGKLTTDQTLWMGATTSPHVRKTSIVSTDGSVTFSTTYPTSTTGQFNISVTNQSYINNWVDQNSSFSALARTGYFIYGTCTATLPGSPLQGDTISFVVDGAFTLTIRAVGTQTIQIASNVSSAAGTQVNTATGDTVTLVYRASDTKWLAQSFVGGWNFT